MGGNDSAAAFSKVYSTNAWGGGSGPGSRGEYLEWYAALVARLAGEHGWATAVDVGCGDGVVAARLPFKDYCGVDPVPAAVRAARGAAAGPGRRFLLVDAYADRDALPAADVLLAKDVLMHWPNRMVEDWVGWLAGQVGVRYRHALVVNDGDQRRAGMDCPIAGYRPLSPALHPLATFKNRFHVVEWFGRKAAVLFSVPPAVHVGDGPVPGDGIDLP